MLINKKAIALLSLSLLLGACSSGGSSSSGGDSDDGPFCSGEQMAGDWRLIGNASGFEISDTITLTQEDAAQTSEFQRTEGDVSLEGTINADCNVISGTFSVQDFTGNFTMVKQ